MRAARPGAAAVAALGMLLACGNARGDAAGGAPRAPHGAAAPVVRTHADTMLDSARDVTARIERRCASDTKMMRLAAALQADLDSARADRDSAVAASPVAPDSARVAARDPARDTARRAPRRPPQRTRHGAARAALAARQVAWRGPVARRAIGESALPGALFPGCRVVSYYGNPFSKRMGILGEIDPDSMLDRLQRQADAYERADSTTPVIPALELIVTVAQGRAGRDGMYRARMPDSVIEKVASWAERRGYLLILDVQVGRSSVRSELAPLMKYLVRPTVHLALDPEFAMRPGKVPGRVIGTLDASQVNVAADTLAALVSEYRLPPKMLIVHRFTRPMLTNHERIHLDPRVQLVIDMDGFGAPVLKRSSYSHYIFDHPVQFAGFKLFYKNDRPLLTPEQVVRLVPSPVFIMYQ